MEKSSRRYFLTLADFIIVSIILGLLISFALPSLTNVVDEAKKASALKISGVLQSSINVSHAKWIASGNPEVISIENEDIIMNNGGWPSANFNDVNGIPTIEGCISLWNSLLKHPPTIGVTCGIETKCEYLVSIKENSKCVFIENKKSSHDAIQYDVNTGKVSVVLQ